MNESGRVILQSVCNTSHVVSYFAVINLIAGNIVVTPTHHVPKKGDPLTHGKAVNSQLIFKILPLADSPVNLQ